MSEMKCRKCAKLLEHGHIIRAEILTRFVALKSRSIYAMEKPESCNWMEHYACSDPFGSILNEE